MLCCSMMQGCRGAKIEPLETVVIPTHLALRWDLFPHRISFMELLFIPSEDGEGGTIEARCDGGSFGAIDTPKVRYGLTVWRSSRLLSVPGSVVIVIPPESEANGEPFSASATVSVHSKKLLRTHALAAYIRGFQITTDVYDTPPSFENEIPYDPSEGYTTGGIGIALEAPERDGDEIRVSIRARNTLLPADRKDMNAAIPLATTWVRVDFIVVGALGRNARAVSAEKSYSSSFAEYGRNTVHPHAAEEEQLFPIQGDPGPDRALMGISAFDIWLNVEERHDPDCIVMQDEINSWDEPVSGPGRYVRELAAALSDQTYDPMKGEGTARLDLFISNSSMYKEIGNLCLGFWGRVTMLQFDDPDAESWPLEPYELELTAGESTTQKIVFDIL